MEISGPEAFKHDGHLGLDSSLKLVATGSLAQWKKEFEVGRNEVVSSREPHDVQQDTLQGNLHKEFRVRAAEDARTSAKQPGNALNELMKLGMKDIDKPLPPIPDEQQVSEEKEQAIHELSKPDPLAPPPSKSEEQSLSHPAKRSKRYIAARKRDPTSHRPTKPPVSKPLPSSRGPIQSQIESLRLSLAQLMPVDDKNDRGASGPALDTIPDQEKTVEAGKPCTPDVPMVMKGVLQALNGIVQVLEKMNEDASGPSGQQEFKRAPSRSGNHKEVSRQ